MRMKQWYLLVFAFALNGCAGVFSPTGATVQYDKYSGAYIVLGAKDIQTDLLSSATLWQWLQASVSKKDGATTIQLHLHSMGGGFERMKFYNAANSSDGRTLVVHPLQEVFDASGHVNEEVVVDLPREYLDQWRPTGLDIKLTGQNQDTNIVKLSAEYVDAFLKQLDAVAKT